MRDEGSRSHGSAPRRSRARHTHRRSRRTASCSSPASSSLRPGEKELVPGDIKAQTQQVFANLRAILEEAGSSLDRLVKTTVFLQDLDDFAGDERGLRDPRRRRRRRLARPSRSRSSRRAHSSRSRRSPSSKQGLREYVGGRSRSITLGLDAYVVGGAVRDELLGSDAKDADFLVPGVDIDGPARRARAARPGRGARRRRTRGRRPLLSATTRTCGSWCGQGSSSPRPAARSRPGPAATTSRSSSTPLRPSSEDLGRRDFTVNAMARRLADGTLVDPYGGRADLEARTLRTVSPSSFAEDPLRLVRGLRFVSQLGLEPDGQTLEQMRDEAASVELVSGERIGGGLAADGMGELSKLLLGAEPARALRLARDTGVLVSLPARVRARDRLRAGKPLALPDRRRAHVPGRAGGRRRRVPAARPAGGALPRPRQAALQPGAAPTGGCTTTQSAASRTGATSRSAHELAGQALDRLRTRPSCASASRASCAAT